MRNPYNSRITLPTLRGRGNDSFSQRESQDASTLRSVRKEIATPERQICIYCRKSIDMDIEEYVTTNKDEVTCQSDYLYAHVKCHDDAIEKNKQ
jgi:hypothetical protein